MAEVAVERSDAVALVTLRRPAKRNALSIALRVELADAIEALVADDEAVSLILTGEGSAFCAGMDVTQFGGDRDHKQRLVDTSERLFGAVARCPKPIVAAVNGPAVAGGFALALLCDVRVAATVASMGFVEAGRHIPPSYAAARAALAPGVARELCLTGRLVDAAEALRLNVVSELCDPDSLLERAWEMAGEIASHSSAALETKRRILLEAESGWGTLLEEETRVMRGALLGA